MSDDEVEITITISRKTSDKGTLLASDETGPTGKLAGMHTAFVEGDTSHRL